VKRRRELVRRFLLSRVVHTQEELAELLAAEGEEVTQATLSRDLAALGARRVTLADGGTAYELAEKPVAPAAGLSQDVRNLVRQVRSNGALVVVHTTPGAASAVAQMIDASRIPLVLGTVAGDDTVFVAPRKASESAKLARALAEPFGVVSEGRR
jgi:transcriptional regulator of arginine metabolism